jgi:rhodanese-related sulfurtransferase
MKTITLKELQTRIGNIVLLEALPSNYFEAEHLPGARNMPLDEIDKLASLLVPDTGAFVVTYCAGTSCPNSKIAAERLETLGYTEVYAYEGGKEDWLAAGLPFEQGRSDTAA